MATLDAVPQAGSSTPTAVAPEDVEAWSQQYDQEQAAAKSQELLPKQEAPHPFQAVSNWVSSLPNRINSAVLDQAVPAVESVYNSKLGRADRDIVAGAAKGVTNVADSAYSFARAAALNFHDNPALRTITGEAAPVAPPESPIWTHAKAAVQDFTDAVKVKDPGIADDLIQYTAQVAPSYLLAGRLLGGLHGVANAVASGIPADAAAIDPHAPRFADILGVLKQTDGKIGQALRAAGPYGLNAYINYLGSNANETEAQGRWKNALDGILPNFIGTELLHAAGITVKQGYAGLRYMVDNGVVSAGDLGAKSAASQRGGPAAARQAMTDPSEALATEQAQKDMANAAANPNGKRPPLFTGSDPAQPIYDAEVRRHVENGSGESAASLEAIERVKAEKKAGITRHVIREDGTVEPLTGVEAVDAKAYGRDLIVQMQDGEPTILSRGPNLPEGHIKGRINGALSNGLLPGSTVTIGPQTVKKLKSGTVHEIASLKDLEK